MTPVELVLCRLLRAKRNRTGWLTRCLSRADYMPSLSVSQGEGGCALLHCFAGCTPEAVVTAMGLKIVDLKPQGQTRTRPTTKTTCPKTYATSQAAAQALANRKGGTVENIYVWT
jgi:fructose-1,6-bisphosphatase/sedoheptulose 1,7-bisphosphatase-like protein